MAGGQEKVLKRRVKSIQSTKKITRAMELIAATRVVKAQQRALAARPYAEQITEVIQHLSAAGAGKEHPLLRQADSVDKVAFVVITSDRGLAGAYNTSVIRAAERDLQGAQSEGADYSLVLIGKKAAGYFNFRNYRIDAQFTGMSDTPAFEHAKEVAGVITEAFLEGDVDQVRLVYTRFLSVASQRVVVRRFMPLQAVPSQESDGPSADYEFEPAPGEIFDRLLPRYVEARLLAAMLDAAASEHAARQRAMKSATDNAEELETKLSRAMNRARQDSITSEIMEIVGGAEAMSHS
ncbi:MAG: F0F1 ATP synthase subunit gamma [Actinobacteria bacterium]|nr:F0F1 ATP synthase subunit gamma [Actinomycetota bacterium]